MDKKVYKIKNYNYDEAARLLKKYPNGLSESEKNKRLSFFQKEILKDKDIQKIKKVNNTCIITYQDGQIFKCSGWLVENSAIIQFSKSKKIFDF